MGIRSCILVLALLAATPAHSQSGRRPFSQSQTIRGTNGQVLGSVMNPGAALGGSFIPVMGNRTAATPLQNGVYKISLGFTGTGWRENFVVGLPALYAGPSPVLVLFHGYGEEPEDLLTSTSLFSKARARGWVVVAPLGAHKFNFGVEYSQVNTERVLDWMAQYLTIDVDRIYGVGFSMGAGWMSSFAARHQNPEGIRFAALVNHTGSTSISDVWWNSVDTTLLESPLMFGGTPATHAFEYSIASSMDLLQATNTVDPTTDMLRNLSGTPIQSFSVLGEYNQYLVNQTEVYDGHYASLGGTSDLIQVPGGTHNWNTIDEDATLDWLFQHTYAEPDPGVLHAKLADRDGKWDYFQVTQDAPGAFSPFNWIAVDSLNRLYVTDTVNIERLSVDPDDVELDRTASLEVVISNADGTATDLVLRGYAQPPSSVLRNGAPTANWTHDATRGGRLILHEPTGANFPLWTIVP